MQVRGFETRGEEGIGKIGEKVQVEDIVGTEEHFIAAIVLFYGEP